MWSSLVSAFVGIVIIHFLKPEELGIWQSLTIFMMYTPLLDLGVTHGLNRELPYLSGKGYYSRSIVLARTGQYYTIIICIILGIISVIGNFIVFFMGYSSTNILFSTISISILAIIAIYEKYLTVTFRSSQSFIILSRIIFSRTILQLILFPLIILFSFKGYILYQTLISLIYLILLHLNRPIKDKPAFKKFFLLKLFRTGFPVFLIGFLRGISNTFIKTILLISGGAVAVGMFTPVIAIGSIAMLIPSFMASYLYPKMSFKFGQNSDKTEIWNIVKKVNLFFGLLSIPLIFVLWFILPIIMNKFFYSYIDVLPAMRLFLLSFIFSGLFATHDALYTVKEYFLGYVYVFIELLLKWVLPYSFVFFINGNLYTNISLGILLSNLVLYILNILFLYLALNSKTKIK